MVPGRLAWGRRGLMRLWGRRGPVRPWGRRLSFAAVLVVAAIAPGPASGSGSLLCRRAHCEIAGSVQWARLLPGRWAARSGIEGTTPAHGQAYTALDGQIAVIGHGMTTRAYAVGTGRLLWTAALTGFPGGSAIVSVRAWPGVVTAGVALPPAQGQARTGTGGAPARADGRPRTEVVLRATTGRRIRSYPAARFGGAVAAGPASTAIVGTHAVTRYSNRTGRVLWSRPTGRVPQSWKLSGAYLYVTVAAGGYLGTAPVTALRRIDLRTGAEHLVRAPGRHFAGTLSLVFDGVVLFTSASGVTAYSAATGARLWFRRGALPESTDAVAQRLYLLLGSVLTGVDPLTGATLSRVSGAATVASSGFYTVREGAVLGLDNGALGKAWGYNVSTQRVVWTSQPLPWPHYFVGSSGIGGSTSPGQGVVLLTVCEQTGASLPHGGGQRCSRPELVALNR